MEELDKFMKEAGAKFPVAYDAQKELYGAYGVRGFPDMALLKDGEVVFKGHPRTLTDAELESFLQ